MKAAAIHLRRIDVSKTAGAGAGAAAGAADPLATENVPKVAQLSKSLGLPTGALLQKMQLHLSNSTPKNGPNSVAGLLQKVFRQKIVSVHLTLVFYIDYKIK